MSRLIVRASSEADVARCAEIYAHHVLYGTASFEVDPGCLPSRSSFITGLLFLCGTGLSILLTLAIGAAVGFSLALKDQ